MKKKSETLMDISIGILLVIGPALIGVGCTLGLNKLPGLVLLIAGIVLNLIGYFLNIWLSRRTTGKVTIYKALIAQLAEREKYITELESKLEAINIQFTKEKITPQESLAKLVTEIAMETLIKDLMQIKKIRFRANIMLPDKSDNLRIWTSINMEGTPDRNIVLPQGAGVCGMSVEHKKTIIATLTRKNMALFHLPPRFKTDLKNVASVVSVPLFGGNQVKGVLNVDTYGTKVSLSFWKKSGALEQIIKVANTITAFINHLDPGIFDSFKMKARKGRP